MKVVKPQKLGLLLRVYEQDRRCWLTVSILAMFPFDSPSRLFPEAELWPFAQKALGADPVLDAGLPKPRGEVLVTGKAHNVGGSKTARTVHLELGPIDKSLWVIGDRTWPYDIFTGKPSNKHTEPVPFDEMPLDWEHAYGGEGYAHNPVGRGYWTRKSLGARAVALPNVENPRDPVTSPDVQPEPAGFGAHDIMWPQRLSKAGTYDKRWLAEQFPGFALDMDPGIFNAAPADQWLTGFFRGDEPFAIDGMHPDKERVAGRLPGLVGRAFVTLRTAAGEQWRELAMQLDTVRLFPADERAIVVFRGTTEIVEDDGDDVVHLLIAAEKLGAPPRSASHYRVLLAQRLDRKKGAAYALRDRDLVPDPDADAPAVDGPFADALADAYPIENLQMAAMKRRMNSELAAAQETIREAGLDPAKWALPPLPEDEVIPEDPVERAEYQERMIAKAQALAEQAKTESEARARAECAKAGLDYDAVLAAAQAEGGGPPKFSAKAELERLRALASLSRIGGVPNVDAEARLADPGLEAKLVTLEQQILGIYRGFAHHFPPAPPGSAERSQSLRAELANAAHLEPRPSFAGRDLTGADLRGLDLSGYDLTEALLEGAKLDGARMSKARLSGAVLTRGSLVDACLDGAELVRANLGRADLSRASFQGATLGRAILTGAKLHATRFEGAVLDDADLAEASFSGASFVRARGARLTFTGAMLDGCCFDDANLERCRFLECSLLDASFVRASLSEATLMNVTGVGAVFDDAKLDGLRVVQACELLLASFARSSLVRANLREAVLEGADFDGANLSHADLSKAKLAGANLHRVLAREARFDRADLSRANLTGSDCMLGSFHRAIVRGADMRGASFFGADFARLVLDRETALAGSLLGRVRRVERTEADGS